METVTITKDQFEALKDAANALGFVLIAPDEAPLRKDLGAIALKARAAASAAENDYGTDRWAERLWAVSQGA